METEEIKNENNNITDAKTELPPDVVSILLILQKLNPQKT